MAAQTGDGKLADGTGGAIDSARYDRHTREREITPEVADGFEKALTTENAELDGFRTWASKVKSEADYHTEPQYNILKERVTPICKAGVLDSADGALQLPGAMRDNYYVYSAAEVAVFKARCGRLMPLLQKQL